MSNSHKTGSVFKFVDAFDTAGQHARSQEESDEDERRRKYRKLWKQDEARSDEEADERENTWRKAKTSLNPIELDYSDEQEAHILGINIIKPHRFFMGGRNYEHANKMTPILERFLCEISPEDRQIFFNVKRPMAVGTLTIQETRDIVDNLIRNWDSIETSESSIKINKLLRSLGRFDRTSDIARIQNVLSKLHQLIHDAAEKDLPEGSDRNLKSSQVQLAKEMRRKRRDMAAQDYFELWKELNNDADFKALDITDENAEDLYLRPKDAAERDEKAEKGFRKFMEDLKNPEKIRKEYDEETARFEEWKASGRPMPQIRISTTEMREDIERLFDVEQKKEEKKEKNPSNFAERLRMNLKTKVKNGIFGVEEKKKQKMNEPPLVSTTSKEPLIDYTAQGSDRFGMSPRKERKDGPDDVALPSSSDDSTEEE